MRLIKQSAITSAPRLAPELARRTRIAIIRADYNREITLSLQKKCEARLVEGGVLAQNILHVSVPGCFEIPLVARRLAAQKRYQAMIALGAVIRGDTYHFDLVTSECARGVMQVALEYDVPVIFEVLATYRRKDALRRAGDNRLNKGIEAAEAALSILATLRDLERKR